MKLLELSLFAALLSFGQNLAYASSQEAPIEVLAAISNNDCGKSIKILRDYKETHSKLTKKITDKIDKRLDSCRGVPDIVIAFAKEEITAQKARPVEAIAAAPEPVATAVASVASAAPAPAAIVIDPLFDQNSLLSKRSVHYPLGMSIVQDTDKTLLRAHAKYLLAHPNRKVRLAGNCDERGGAEYNLALGQRRADGVKRELILNGASPEQISTISYGEEKPRLTCHEEKCWEENRRTDLIYAP